MLYLQIYKCTQNTNLKNYYRNYKQIYKKVIRTANNYDFNKEIVKSGNITETAWKFKNSVVSKNLKWKWMKRLNKSTGVAGAFNTLFV